jgi:hypothetical protein
MVVLSPRYRFRCALTADIFLNWTDGQTHPIEYAKTRKMPNKEVYRWNWKKKDVPLQYARLVHQFKLEKSHGENDPGHESLRRRTYAERVLDMFGSELDSFKGKPVEFRSKVFSPILQRQLRGVSDAYAPSIRRAVNPRTGEPTISEVTQFYLGNDPLDPRCIPSYRRNIIYIREARWHLRILMGKATFSSTQDFNNSLEHHDILINALRGAPSPGTRGIPHFREMDVAILVSDGIETYFEEELSWTVCSFIVYTRLLIIFSIARPSTRGNRLSKRARCIIVPSPTLIPHSFHQDNSHQPPQGR